MGTVFEAIWSGAVLTAIVVGLPYVAYLLTRKEGESFFYESEE